MGYIIDPNQLLFPRHSPNPHQLTLSSHYLQQALIILPFLQKLFLLGQIFHINTQNYNPLKLLAHFKTGVLMLKTH